MEITRSVHIDAPVEKVFALIADPHARAQLNPNLTPLYVEIEDGRPLHKGSVCRYRVQTGKQIVDFRSRVQLLEPNRRLIAVVDTAVPIEVDIQVEAQGAGTVLKHSERFDPNEAMLQTAASEEHNRVMAFVYRVLMWFDLDIAQSLRQQRERRLKQQLEENLGRWLEAIKAKLERAGVEAESTKAVSS